jgi:hypothetical protein
MTPKTTMVTSSTTETAAVDPTVVVDLVPIEMDHDDNNNLLHNKLSHENDDDDDDIPSTASTNETESTSISSSTAECTTNTTNTPTFQSMVKTWQQRLFLVGKHQEKTHQDVVVVTDDQRQHSTEFDTISTESTLYKCLQFLSSTDIDLNRVGLQRLMLLTRGRRTPSSSLHDSSSTELVAPALIYGGPLGSIQEQLRYIFSTMICDDPHNDYYYCCDGSNTQVLDIDIKLLDLLDQEEGDREYGIDCDSVSSSSSSGLQYCGPQGKASGALHNLGLRVLANALPQIMVQQHHHQQQQQQQVDESFLHDTIWKSIIRSLFHDIETNHTPGSTGYALRILRLLYNIRPDIIGPLLQHTLYPHLVYLKDYGKQHLFPTIHAESSYILQRINQQKW